MREIKRTQELLQVKTFELGEFKIISRAEGENAPTFCIYYKTVCILAHIGSAQIFLLKELLSEVS